MHVLIVAVLILHDRAKFFCNLKSFLFVSMVGWYLHCINCLRYLLCQADILKFWNNLLGRACWSSVHLWGSITLLRVTSGRLPSSMEVPRPPWQKCQCLTTTTLSRCILISKHNIPCSTLPPLHVILCVCSSSYPLGRWLQAAARPSWTCYSPNKPAPSASPRTLLASDLDHLGGLCCACYSMSWRA